MVDTGKEEQKCDEDLIGRTVKKLFTGYGYFNGKVISFNCRSGYYRVKYDDGDREELELHELKEILADVKNDLAASERPASASRKRLHENDRVEVCGQTEERKLRSKQREVRNKKSKSSSKEIIVGEITTRNSGGDLVNTVAVDVLNGLIKEETVEQTEEPSSSTRSRSRQLGGPNSQNPPHDEEKGKQGEDQLSKKDNRISKKRVLETPVPDGKSPASRASKRLRECKIPSTPLQQILVSGDKEVGTKVDSSDDDCEESESSGIEEHQKSDSQVQALEVPPLRPLPPSSTDLPIPIESVADLFEVFTFLRSFSWVLFLSPFLLKDFAACLVLKEANGMIDSVHVSLLRLLQRHLERLAADGSKMATIVLRHRDWNFLDSVTWPSYLVAFLLTHGFSKEHGKSLLQLGKTEYYRVETTTKLAILSFLCQKALETDEIRAEIATRADLEAEIDLDDTKIHTPKSNKWANWRALSDLSVKRSISFDTDSEQANDKSIGLRTRCLSRSVSYDQGSNIQRIQKSNDGGKRHNGLVARFKEPKDIASPTRNLEQLQDDCDWNSDECVLCGMDGNLICCDGCPAAYHSRCIGLCKLSLPDGDWYCPECIIEQQNENLQLRKSLRGSQFLGMDPHGRVYTATCGYLLVSETSSESNAGQSYYYAYPDLPSVLEFLELCGPVFKEIERGIHQLWRFSHDLSGGTTLAPKNELCNADQQPEILNTLSKEMQEFPSLMSSLSREGPSVEMTVFETQISDTKISSPVPKQLSKFGPNSHMAVTNSALVHAQVEIACCNSIINAIQEPKQGVIAPEITTMEQVLEVVDIEKANDMSQLKPLVVPDIGKSNDRCTGGVLLKRLEQAAENLTVGDAFGNKAITGNGSKTFILVEQVDMADSKAGDILNNADIGILSADSSKTVEQVDKDPTVDKESACNAESGKFENNFEKNVVTLHQCKEDSNTEMDINQKLERSSEGHGQGVLVYDSAQLGQHETCQLETKLPAIEIHTGEKVSQPRHEDLEDNNAARPSLRLSQNSNILVDQEHLGSPPSASVLQNITRVRARSQLQEDFLEDERSLKAYLFVNHYILGDAAASAAANFITASAGEKQVLEGTGSQKKAWATLQMKAFSEAPVTFYWPSTKKKLMETPKERCGWCFACQSPNRKTCFLNQVAKKLSAGAALILGGIRSIKKGHDHLPAVASYMLYMEDNIHGLLVGPWEKTEQRRRWRKRVEQAASIHDIKAALLEMGCGLRMVALNNDWSKIVEDAPELIPSSVVAASVAGLSVKKAPGGRRGRREVPHVEKGTISVGGSAWGIHWWRGGRLARNFLDWETLPCATIRKASRQGGVKEIPGLIYSEGLECPRRSRLCAWRARVESAHSISQLALQIRYLDAHIRWHDLSTPESKSDADSFGTGTNSAALKKLRIHAKVLHSGVYLYLMDSEGKHTGALKGVKLKGVKSPSKLNPMWTLTSGSSFKDTTQKGDQVWLNEDDVPLYLLKDFEEQLRKLYPSKLSKSARGRKGKRQNLRLSKTDRLSMLLQKHIQLDDNNDSSSWKCAYCKSVIFARQLVQCQKCCVTFHKECVEASSQVDSFTCSRCLIPRKNKRGRKPKSISLSQNTNLYSSKVSQANRKGKVEDLKPISEMPKDQGSTNLNSVGLVHVQRKKRTSNLYVHKNGVLWRKVKPEADLLTFRRDKIVLVGQHGTDHLRGPICCLCSQPYNPAFMYIGCEFCKEWFHADGFGVSEEKLLLLAGFKCYKCRKKGPPKCPYVGRKDFDHSYLFSQVSLDHVKAMTGGDDRQLVGNIDLDPCVIANITIPVSEEVDELAVAPSIDFLVQEEGFTTGWKPDTEVPLTTIDLVKTHNIVPVPDFDWASLQNEFFSPDADASECNNVQVCEQKGMQTNSYDTSEHERAQPNFQAGGPANYLPQLPCRGPLSFLELLSSEDDMVENVPFTEMDFNLTWPSDVSINEHISSAVLNDNGNFQPGILMSQDAESMDVFDRSLKSGHATEEGGLFGLICESTRANCEIG